MHPRHPPPPPPPPHGPGHRAALVPRTHCLPVQRESACGRASVSASRRGANTAAGAGGPLLPRLPDRLQLLGSPKSLPAGCLALGHLFPCSSGAAAKWLSNAGHMMEQTAMATSLSPRRGGPASLLGPGDPRSAPGMQRARASPRTAAPLRVLCPPARVRGAAVSPRVPAPAALPAHGAYFMSRSVKS